MQDTLLFFLSNENLAEAHHGGMGAQLLHLLAERTDSVWHMTGADTAVELASPYRGIRAWSEIDGNWHAFENEKMARCLRVIIDSPAANFSIGFETEPPIGPEPLIRPEPIERAARLAQSEQPHSIAQLALQFFAARQNAARAHRQIAG